MEQMEKVMKVQRQIREDCKTLNSYMTDLKNWETEMKRKEAALTGVMAQDLPPVRSKIKKEKPAVVKKKPEKRIPSYDYTSWDKFDVDKACEEVDMAEVGPPSLDSKKSEEIKQAKLKEEAQYEKERGNNFVKVEKWDEAIACYNRAIELVKTDPIYYANRGLCHLKKDSLHQAESDCSEALRLDPSYVKALQRRATARERLGSLRAASRDLDQVLLLEPRNHAARRQLEAIRARMGTKGSKSKSSPSPSPLSTPTQETCPFPQRGGQVQIVELPDDPPAPAPAPASPELQWRGGVGENVTVITTVKKPPHLRSKRPLKPVPIQEIPLGRSTPEKPPTRIQIVEVEGGRDERARGDDNNNRSDKDSEMQLPTTKGEGDAASDTCHKEAKLKPEPEKMVNDSLVTEKDASVEKTLIEKLVPPVNSVQFMSEWKNLGGSREAKKHYLSIIDPAKIPSIFSNALESEVLSEFLSLLAEEPARWERGVGVGGYLRAFTRVKRFAALAMFLSAADKQCVRKLLEHCRGAGGAEEVDDLAKRYEL